MGCLTGWEPVPLQAGHLNSGGFVDALFMLDFSKSQGWDATDWRLS
jgi:hypothetical protein